MEDIKVGDYVRINNDFRLIALGIGKVISINQDTVYVKMRFELPFIFKIENITKHSKNIIDLIEVGDYVNGKKIDAILDGGFKSEGVAERVLCFEIDFPIEKGLRAYHNYDIKSIVTKEQFENIEYKLNT